MIPNYLRGEVVSKSNDNEFDNALSGLKSAVSTKSSMFGSYSSGISKSIPMDSTDLAIKQLTDGLDNAAAGIPIPEISKDYIPNQSTPYRSQNLRKNKNKGLIPSLIDILVNIILLPGRFDKMHAALTNSSLSLVNSVSAIGKSAYLGIKDIVLLIVAIVKVVVKYWKCLISFFITTTVGGCFIFHPITFLCYMLYLIFPLTAYFIWIFTGFDLMPFIDSFFEMIDHGDDQFAKWSGFNTTKWPKAVHKWCYTCFFQEVKMKDVLKDVMIVKDIGDLITYDFNMRMPTYFRPANRHGAIAKRNFDALFGG